MNIARIIILSIGLVLTFNSGYSQENLTQTITDLDLRHGIEQYESGQYVQAIHSLEKWLKDHPLPLEENRQLEAPHFNRSRALYYLTLAKILYGAEDLEAYAEQYINKTVSQTHRERVAYTLAHHYFKRNDFDNAIKYYEIAGINSLSNEELADAKFELAYAYFVNSDFDKAYSHFATIKEIETGKYYHAGNYYYGLIAYNRKDYDQALNSFKRIDDLPEYKEIVPYYEAEIYYFKKDYEKVTDLAYRYLDREEKLYYHKELNLLMGKVFFDQKKYKESIPYFEYYYNNSEKVRKENLYELAYAYYQTAKWQKAIEMFKPLSNTQDALGQNSMYLLGDCYLRVGDKSGARNAFSIASNMDFNKQIQEDATFLSGKLSYDLGENARATQALNNYINQFPNADYINEAKSLLVTLLSDSKNYTAALEIISQMQLNTPQLQQIYQKANLGRALQLIRNKESDKALPLLRASLKYAYDKDISAVSKFWLAQLLYDSKDYTDAESNIQSFINHTKNTQSTISNISREATLKNAYILLGYTQMELGNYSAAQQAFTTSGNHVAAHASMQNNDASTFMLKANAAFMNKQYKEADGFYDKALEAKSDNIPYIYYQKALIAGLLKENSRKAVILQKLLKEYPLSEQRDDAEFELATTYLEMNNNTDAIAVLKKLSTSQSSNIASKAMLKLGYAQQQAGRYDDAIQTYEKFIVAYPYHDERNTALSALRGLYLQKGNPDGYIAFLSKEGIEDAASNQELTYFEAADTKFIEESYQEAIKLYTAYLDKFPDGQFKYKALFNRAESYNELNRENNGTADYMSVYNGENKEYAMLAAMRLAVIHYKNEQYNESLKFVNEYLSAAHTTEEQVAGNLLKLQALNKSENYGQEIQKSMELLKQHNDALSEIEKEEVLLVEAKLMQKAENYAEAIKLYEAISDKKMGAISAEARYRKAEVLLRQNKLKEAETACDNAIKENAGEQYWLIKSYILIGEILTAQKDYFNARATLQSVVKNANNKALEMEAQQKLDIVNQLEKENSKVHE